MERKDTQVILIPQDTAHKLQRIDDSIQMLRRNFNELIGGLHEANKLDDGSWTFAQGFTMLVKVPPPEQKEEPGEEIKP